MLVLTGLERQMTADFKEALAAQLPDLEIAIGSVEDRPERVEFMLSWAPREDEVARYPNLRFICSGGAGVGQSPRPLRVEAREARRPRDRRCRCRPRI